MASIIVDNQSHFPSESRPAKPTDALVAHVMGLVNDWRDVRNNAYSARWDGWYNTIRGKWTPDTKNKKRERSKLISPLSSMAVDLTVADIIEALIGRESLVDITDDVDDDEKKDMEVIRKRLLEDLYKDGIVRTLIDIVWNGTVYGTGIAKINIDVVDEVTPKVVDEIGKDGKTTKRLKKVVTERVKVFPAPVEPGQFVPDPSASNIDDMLGMGYEYKLPLHKIWKRQKAKTYFDHVHVSPMSGPEEGTENRQEEYTQSGVKTYAGITEYHGLVPTSMLNSSIANKGRAAPEGTDDHTSKKDMTEAVIVIANKVDLLRAIPNPSIMEDRAFVSYQHDTVPNRFWGRGVMEKGHHPQKASDAELRSRADSLAWINNPMLAGDLTKLPPRMNLNVWPGRFFGLKGDPGKSLQEFKFGDVNQSTFVQTQEFERMHQQATGAVDPAGIGQGVRDQATGATAINVSGITKRAKRTLFNVEGFMQTLIRRILWRKMQFEPDRYPLDIKFQVRGSMGMMARELEQMFLSQMFQNTDPQGQTHLLLLKAIFENSASPAREEILNDINEQLKPPSEEEQKRQEAVESAQQQLIIEDLQNKRADTALKLAMGDKNKAEALLKKIEADFKDDEMFLENLKVAIDRTTVENQERQTDLTERGLDIQNKKLDIESRKIDKDKKKDK